MIFVYTIAIGILNGADLWEPSHDLLMSHVHSGTLGWITLAVAGLAVAVFDRSTQPAPGPAPAPVHRGIDRLAWALVAAVVAYIAAFAVGGTFFADRIQRPVVGTALFVPVVWFLVWSIRAYRSHPAPGAAHLGLVLAWLSLVIGAVFGVVLGLSTSGRDLPGLGDEIGARISDAHPPAMVIGYLLVAGFAIVEWLLHPEDTTRAPRIGIWLLFVAGLTVNVGFVTGTDEQLVGPANALMIVAALMVLWRSRHLLRPAVLRRAGPGLYPRFALAFLVAYLVMLSVIVSWIAGDTIDFRAPTESQEAFLLAFDHTMFIGVMTNLLVGSLARFDPTPRRGDRFMWWGTNIGLVGFALGLITTTSVVKEIFAPLMGLSLLVGLIDRGRGLGTVHLPASGVA
ncbi:MAG: hypothetical protein D6683_05415 [Actinomyces sp.]|nr:MAG: hypothetical protein D6683_05415 [Actinomyces sp.]